MLTKNLPLVSIIIPCHNSSLFIENCLKSLSMQTYKNLEIIAVDDFSDDDTFKILSFYAQNDSRFIATRSLNKGVSSARNQGLKLANGEFITFIDSDDYVSPVHIEILVNLAVKNNADAVVTGYKRVSENKPINLTKNRRPKKLKTQCFHGLNALKQYLCQKKFEYSVWNKLYKANILKDNDVLFDENCCYNEDSLFNYKFFKHAKKTVYSNFTTYFYVQRKNSLVHRPFNPTKFTAFISLNNIVKDAYQNLPDIIPYAHVMRLTICCELIFYIKFYKYNGKKFDNGAIINKIIDYISVDRKYLKTCKQAHFYRRTLMPLIPPVAKLLLCKRRKLSGELPEQFFITDK